MGKNKKMDKARQENQKRAKEAMYEVDAKKPLPKTWSARMPAYAGTVLCVDRRYWPKRGYVEKQEEIRLKGKRYPQKNGGNSVLAPAQLEQEEYLDGERVYKKRV